MPSPAPTVTAGVPRAFAGTLPPARLVTLPSGTTLATTDTGTGAPVVLVHGSLCDYRYWAPQIPALAQQYRVLSVSLSHYYPTRDANAGLPFRWADHADELAAFIDAHVGGPAHVVAHSRGAYVAFQLAARAPHAVASLTLADPGGAPATPDGRPATDSEDVRSLRAEAVAMIAAGDVDGGLERFVDSVSRPGSWAQSPAAFQTMARDNAHTLGPQFTDTMVPFDDADARALGMPVLLVAGERSPQMFHRNLDWLAARIPQAQRVSIAGASHGMNLAHPRAFNRAVMDFLDPVGNTV